jgi:exodeoxyribonuclease-5
MVLPQPKSIASGTDSDLALTAEQRARLEALNAFVRAPRNCTADGLRGHRHKTTLLQVFISGLRDRGDERPIVLSALATKATKVLAAMAAQWRLDIDAMTCCKLLGLRPIIDEENGKQVFAIDRQQASQIDRYRLVIIDECSMINQELWSCW